MPTVEDLLDYERIEEALNRPGVQGYTVDDTFGYRITITRRPEIVYDNETG